MLLSRTMGSAAVAVDDNATLELCFWTFAALVPRQKPYYSRSMCGMLVDRFVLDDVGTVS